jgi:hypothetical protein
MVGVFSPSTSCPFSDLPILHRLVATIGQQSTLKKVGRKAILNVDVPKACESILESEVPLALRLQSNLL